MKFSQLLKTKKFVFLPYVCLGYPTLEKSLEIVQALEPYADGFELGIPFSDPVADGPVLQHASHTALQTGFKVTQTFDAIRAVRKYTDKPIAIMTYFNPVLAYGLDRFVADAHAVGADALIIPDAPLEEIGPIQAACAGQLEVPLFISPTTPKERAQRIADKSEGFVYGVAVKGVTGVRQEAEIDARELVEKASGKPVAIGFGVSTAQQAEAIRDAGAAGFIVGSKIAQIYGENGLEDVKELAKSLSLITRTQTSLKVTG